MSFKEVSRDEAERLHPLVNYNGSRCIMFKPDGGNVGRSRLKPLMGNCGGLAGDFTVTRLAEDALPVVGSGMAERSHQRFFAELPLPKGTR